MATYKETLRRLALNDEPFAESLLGLDQQTIEASALCPKVHALVRLAAAVAIDSAPSSYCSTIDQALAAGAEIDDVVATLIAVGPVVGLSRVVSAAPQLARALGYDLDADFEGLPDDEP
jgi:hypothetical protein